MKPGLKRFLLGVVIFAWFSYKIFPHTFDPLFYDICSVEYADMRVDELLSTDKKPSKKKQKALDDINKALAVYDIPPEHVLSAKKDMVRYGWYIKSKQCEMPQEVEDGFFKWTLGSQDSGTKDCPSDFYTKESQVAYALLKMNKVELEKLEASALSAIVNGTRGSSKAKELVEKKWTDPQFREKTIIRAIQVGQRLEEGCRDATLPLKDIIKDILLEY